MIKNEFSRKMELHFDLAFQYQNMVQKCAFSDFIQFVSYTKDPSDSEKGGLLDRTHLFHEVSMSSLVWFSAKNPTTPR